MPEPDPVEEPVEADEPDDDEDLASLELEDEPADEPEDELDAAAAVSAFPLPARLSVR